MDSMLTSVAEALRKQGADIVRVDSRNMAEVHLAVDQVLAQVVAERGGDAEHLLRLRQLVAVALNTAAAKGVNLAEALDDLARCACV